MGRKSSVTKLPRDIYKGLVQLILDGRLTQEELRDWVNERADVEISKGAMQRFASRMSEVTKEMRLAYELAEQSTRELDRADGTMGRFLAESLQTLILQCRLDIAKDGPVDPGVVERLTQSLKNVQQALKATVDTELKIRDKVTKEAATAAEKVAKAQGASAEFAALIREAIMGTRRAA
jgi:hypothetical protein